MERRLSCDGCWWSEGGRCYVGDPELDENGRSPVRAKERCAEYRPKLTELFGPLEPPFESEEVRRDPEDSRVYRKAADRG